MGKGGGWGGGGRKREEEWEVGGRGRRKRGKGNGRRGKKRRRGRGKKRRRRRGRRKMRTKEENEDEEGAQTHKPTIFVIPLFPFIPLFLVKSTILYLYISFSSFPISLSTPSISIPLRITPHNNLNSIYKQTNKQPQQPH